MSAPESVRTRPRILHVVDSLAPGGLQANLVVLIARTRERFAHHVCCIRESGIVAEPLQTLGVPIAVLGKQSGHDWSLAWRIARHCREVRPHVVHTRNWGAIDGIVGARLARVPIVIHSEHGFDSPQIPLRRRWLLWVLSPFVDRVLAVSDNLRQRLQVEVGVPAHKVLLARNGVDPLRFHPRTDGALLRQKHGYAATDFVIGAVGRLDAVKNHVGLVAAFAELSHCRPEARLLLIGEGPERERIEREVERLGLGSQVRLVGHQMQVEEWLAMFDLFAYASHFEGTTNGVLEAMATGLPVVATCVGGLPEVIVDGVTGRLVSAGDTGALAAAIDFYGGDAMARATHGAAGRARAVAEFTLEAMIAAYATTYEGALVRRRVIAAADPYSRER